MEQGFKAICHDQDTDRVDIRFLRRECRTDLPVCNHKLLHMVTDKNVLFLLLPQNPVCAVDLKLIRQRHTAVAIDLDLRIADRKNGSGDLFLFQHQPLWLTAL